MKVYDMTHASDVIREDSLCQTLQARMGTGGNQVPLVIYNSYLKQGQVTESGVCQTLTAQMANQTDMPLAIEQECRPLCMTKLCRQDQSQNMGIGNEGDPAFTLTSVNGEAGVLSAQAVYENQRCEVKLQEVSNALTTPGGRPGQGNPVVFIAENIIGRKPENGGDGNGYSEGVCYTLNATGVHGVCAPPPPHCFKIRSGCEGGGKGYLGQDERSFTLSTGHDQDVFTAGRFRRLTPVECERLQGFPDNWTRISWRGKTEENCPDAPRYKAIGNSWAVPCVRWIGRRIQKAVEKA